jgi:hypothetical protein
VRAVGLYKHLPIDDPESLVDIDVPKPAPSGRELLVEVGAISDSLGAINAANLRRAHQLVAGFA